MKLAAQHMNLNMVFGEDNPNTTDEAPVITDTEGDHSRQEQLQQTPTDRLNLNGRCRWDPSIEPPFWPYVLSNKSFFW